MRTIILLTILTLPVITQAQTSGQEQIKALNNDIWIPFVKGINNNDSAMYNGVNSKDFYWVSDGTKQRIMNLREYIDDARLVMNSRHSKGTRTGIEVRFLNRNINNEFASERCAVKFSAVLADGKTEVSYSLMHVFSRKENGVWKKWIQYPLAGPVSKEQFENAKPLE